MTYFAIAVVLTVTALLGFLSWGSRWGSTAEERARRMPGDDFLAGGAGRRLAMTRAVSIKALPELVWPWIAQIGRSAGWYSIDTLDNGAKASAKHIVSWIPEPRLGDASPIGYLRHLEPGRALAWWVKGLRFLGAWARLVVAAQVASEDGGSRLVIRMSADAQGLMARPALTVFRFMDSIMAIWQLLGIRNRVEQFGARTSNPGDPETGDRAQYQLYEVIYASGERAGKRGKEHAERWRQTAIEDGYLLE